MTITFEAVQFLAGNSDGATKRTMTQRTAEIFNVKDYGAKGDGSTNDAAAILSAFTAMYSSGTGSGIVFFPPGNYTVNSTIDISNSNGGSKFTSGIVRGSGKFSTTITGTLNNGFIFSQTDGLNGPEEISNIGFINSSTTIGSGALMINNTSMRITNCSFASMANLIMPSNIYNVEIESCAFGNNIDVTTGTTGTFGIAGGAANISGCRSTGSFQAGIQLGGGEPCVVAGNSNENCTVGLVAGMNTGWASACTVSNGSGGSGNILVVGGNLGSSAATKQFVVGAEIFMKGLTTTADWGISPLSVTICTITEDHNNNPSRTGNGFAGTYTISRSALITSAVPCISRYQSTLAGAKIAGYGTEASYYTIFALATAACVFDACGGSGTPTECVDAFGNTGLQANTCFYLYNVQACSFIGCTNNSHPSNAGFYFDPAKDQIVSLISCNSGKSAGVAGDDYILPTTPSGKTGVELFNTVPQNLPVGYTSGLNSLNRTFASLPGNVGSNSNIQAVIGMSYTIVDGAKSGGGTALYGDILQGGGSQKVMAFYDGTNWTRN